MNKPVAGQSSGMPGTAAQPTEVLAGSIERVTFHNAENGFCVLRVKALGHRDLVTVVGHAAEISAGEWVTVSGTWVNSREHSQQFKASFLRSYKEDRDVLSGLSVDGFEKPAVGDEMSAVACAGHGYGENDYRVPTSAKRPRRWRNPLLSRCVSQP